MAPPPSPSVIPSLSLPHSTFLSVQQEWVSKEHCARRLICRGLNRACCVLMLDPILSFLTVTGFINVGLVSPPPYLKLHTESQVDNEDDINNNSSNNNNDNIDYSSSSSGSSSSSSRHSRSNRCAWTYMNCHIFTHTDLHIDTCMFACTYAQICKQAYPYSHFHTQLELNL